MSDLRLNPAQIAEFQANGFLALPALFSSSMIEEARSLLDPLFSRFSELPGHIKRDLGASISSEKGTTVRSAEINRPTLLEPYLRHSEVFRACRAVARQLTGPFAAYTFDHAIYKSANNQRATHWHQDHAYNGHRKILNTVHFWVPLQAATLESGCMQFVPGSHLVGDVPHQQHENGHTLHVSEPAASEVVVCPLPKGGCTIHNPLTMHYTGANSTTEIRRAWIIHFGPWGRLSKFHPSILRDRVVRSINR
jgi:ectoine hydroxylase-related dioxygenase (phytanoyl-CoA dioxygenase family)